MKTTYIVSKHGKFRILMAVEGDRKATAEQMENALTIALHRIERDERRFDRLRAERAKKRTARGAKAALQKEAKEMKQGKHGH